jgi:Fe-S-cluster containining protein
LRPDAAREPGLAGVVPFRFACHRCGHCCTGGAGYVWLAEGESARMAQLLGLDRAAFEARFVRTVPDPRTGALRQSLRERDEGAGGRCALLEGQNHCSVYAARPAHCARFPYWDAVLSERDAFERARATCPGLAVEPTPAQRAAAFAQLAELYAEVDAFIERANPVCLTRGVCCRFEDAGHELFATGLEADFAADLHPSAPPPEAPGRCPYHVAGRCTARAGRPLGCRTYFCDRRTRSVLEEAHEHFLARVRDIERATGYPVTYGRFPAQLLARGVGGNSAPDPSSD